VWLAAAGWAQPAPARAEPSQFSEIEDILAELTKITGLKPSKPVPHSLINREEVKQFLAKRMKEELKPPSCGPRN